MRFFNDSELASMEDQVAKGCKKCGLDKKCKSSKMRVGGKGKLSTLIVSDYPGEQDDQIGRPFMGNANINFLNLLRGKGYDPLEDFWFTNAINCRKSNKDDTTLEPSDSEIKCCRPYVEGIIGELQPRNIIVLGDYAVKSFFPFLGKANTEMLRGFTIPDQEKKTWIHTTISPRTIEKQSFNKNLSAVYNRDLDNIFRKLNAPFTVYEEPLIEILTSVPNILSRLEHIIRTKPPCYIDYETTGLKPYYNGHKIVSMSIAYLEKGVKFTVSFPYCYRNFLTNDERGKVRFCIKKILASGIPLSAHNIKFEDSWSRNIIKMRPKNWAFDTQIAAHILDNRRGITGLKQQVYLNFGIRPYNEHIQPLLMRQEGSEFNRVDDIPLNDLLQYGGLDSSYGIDLEHIQREKLTERNLWSPYNFFHRGTLLMSNMQEKGIHTEEDYYHEQSEIIGIRIDELNNKLMTSKEAILFKKKEGREIDPASGTDLGLLFYTHMKTKKVMTKKGNLSVDKITLEKIDNPFVKDLLYLRKLEKTKNTYFSQFLREVYNGRMNPFFNLSIPISYRSSSSEPNFQNIPTRDEEIKKLVRSGVKASPGRQLLFWDGQGMEVCTSVCYHRDPNMIKYITDPTTDMHRDTAADIWMLPKTEVTKDIRFYAKNMWVFAEFYGSYYVDCGTNLWETCINNLNLKTVSGVTLQQHLVDKDITTLNQFLEHCKEVERIFWKERFKVYDKWKWDTNEEYRRNGFIQSKMGFVFGGIMNRKQVSNYPIQGTAFHLLLWSLIQIEDIAIKERWKSNLIAQIHDEGIMDAVPEEIPHIIATAKHVTEVLMPKEFPWINVPFGLDISVSPLNGSWYDKKEIK
jgi:DNA polymerase-1